MYYDFIETQIGKIYMVINKDGLVRIELIEEKWQKYNERNKPVRDEKLCFYVKKQLCEYFNGQRKTFNLPIVIEGTEFRKKVWNALYDIPYGETQSYYDIAKKIGHEKATRAIGQANKSNLIPIIIPCHRVVGKNNKIRGYIGDNIDVQLKLLELEKTYK